MSNQPAITLNDGRAIPQIGLGVWQASEDDTATAVAAALAAGYRHIDTAAIYQNERGVGQVIRTAGLPRDALFITTKLWNEDQGLHTPAAAIEKSLEKLGLDYVDLYLIHWPSPWRGHYLESWQALIKLKEAGLARSIGVSNFTDEHLKHIIAETGVTPTLNQIELHPHFQQRAMRDVNTAYGIETQSWSPLGQGQLLQDPVIGEIARKHGRSPAQVIIRWHLDSGLIVIPKSVTPSRIAENFAALTFQLDAADIAAIAALDSAEGRIGDHPATATF